MEPEPLPYGDKKALVEEARKLGRFTPYEDLVAGIEPAEPYRPQNLLLEQAD